MSDFPNGPRFEWSVSKQETFNWCKRKYFYNYYGYWGGWGSQTRSQLAVNTYFFKNLKNIPGWIGDLAHQEIGYLLQGKKEPEQSITDARSRAKSRWNTAVVNANKFKSGEILKTKDELLFLEHINDEPDPQTLDYAMNQITDCIQSVIDNGVHDTFKEARKNGRYSFVETQLGNEKFRDMAIFYPFKKSGVTFKVYSMLDCVVEHEKNSFLIYDWKTGFLGAQKEEKPLQVRLYAKWLVEKLGLTDDHKIEAYTVHLPDFEFTGGALSISEIEDTYSRVIDSATDLHDIHLRLVDQDGRPMPDDGSLELCSTNPTESGCKFCNWNSMCESGIEILST